MSQKKQIPAGEQQMASPVNEHKIGEPQAGAHVPIGSLEGAARVLSDAKPLAERNIYIVGPAPASRGSDSVGVPRPAVVRYLGVGVSVRIQVDYPRGTPR